MVGPTPRTWIPAALLLLLLLLAGAAAPAALDEWPQFLGPERAGVYRGPALADGWPAGGPRAVWRKAIGQGFSGPIVAGGRVILFHRVGDREVVEALDPRTGAGQWQYGY